MKKITLLCLILILSCFKARSQFQIGKDTYKGRYAQKSNYTAVIGSFGVIGTMRYVGNYLSLGYQFNEWRASAVYLVGHKGDNPDRAGGELLYSVMAEKSKVLDVFAGMIYVRDIDQNRYTGALKLETNLYWNRFTNIGISAGAGEEILWLELKWMIKL